MPKVSVIMGIYNCATTLEESIDSILSQTYPDWELIMCDDNSLDETYTIAFNYSKKYNQITVLRNEVNRGLNYTLNRCLQAVSGVYIARMDGDDVSLPQRIEKEVTFLENNPHIAFVSAAMEYFDELGTWGRSSLKEEPKPVDFVKGTPFCHAPCMVRKESYEAVCGYTVDKKLMRVEDYHLWIKLYTKGYKGYNLQEVLYRMRDDRNAAKRRLFKFRINEARVICIAINQLGLNKLYCIYSLRPLIVGLFPAIVYKYIHKNRFKYSSADGV